MNASALCGYEFVHRHDVLLRTRWFVSQGIEQCSQRQSVKGDQPPLFVPHERHPRSPDSVESDVADSPVEFPAHTGRPRRGRESVGFRPPTRFRINICRVTPNSAKCFLARLAETLDYSIAKE